LPPANAAELRNIAAIIAAFGVGGGGVEIAGAGAGGALVAIAIATALPALLPMRALCEGGRKGGRARNKQG